MPCSKCHGTGHNAATCAAAGASPGARGAAAAGAPRVGGAAATPERHCSTCRKAGHNRATCPDAAAASPAGGAPVAVGAPAAGGAPAAPDADDLGGLAAALGGADIGGAGERASDADLLLLHAEELRDICEHRLLPAGGSKSALVERLVASRIKYRDLVIDDLKDVLHALKLPVGGRKADLVARLVEHNRAGGRRALPPLDRSEKPAGFEGGPMSRATYRARMKDLGMGAMADQDVCHIISEDNGGANHSDNFFIGGRSLNRGLGSGFDALNVRIVGIEKGKLAVAASVAMNGYAGPSAEELFRKGADLFRTLRHDRRAADEK